MKSREKTQEFWRWFSRNAPNFGGTFQNEELLSQLDSWVISLGSFGWEVGPGKTAENAFVLSPGGEKARLLETQAIIAAAPSLPGWEFHSAKPPRLWDPHFTIQDAGGNSVDVDAGEWQCVLLRYPDGLREVVVEADNLGALSEVYRKWAAEIALDGLLGEQRRLESVDKVTVVEELSERERIAAFPIAEIADRVPR